MVKPPFVITMYSQPFAPTSQNLLTALGMSKSFRETIVSHRAAFTIPTDLIAMNHLLKTNVFERYQHTIMVKWRLVQESLPPPRVARRPPIAPVGAGCVPCLNWRQSCHVPPQPLRRLPKGRPAQHNARRLLSHPIISFPSLCHPAGLCHLETRRAYAYGLTLPVSLKCSRVDLLRLSCIHKGLLLTQEV